MPGLEANPRDGSWAACPPACPTVPACPKALASTAHMETKGQPHSPHLFAVTPQRVPPNPRHPQQGVGYPRDLPGRDHLLIKPLLTRGTRSGVPPLTHPLKLGDYHGTKWVSWSLHGTAQGRGLCPRHPPLNPCWPPTPLRGLLPCRQVAQDVGTRLFPSPNTQVPLVPAPHAPLQLGRMLS